MLLAAFCVPIAAVAQRIPTGAAIDAEVGKIMTRTHAKGMAVAVIDRGKVGYVHAYGVRNAKGDPLTTDTVMYGASLTKTVFAYTVMQLVDQRKLTLDTPLKDYLDKPLPSYGPDPVFPDKYGPYKDLADDSRWEKITPRMCLTHSTGFANFWFIEPDQKLRIHFEPGTRYAYSGEGLILLQFVIEHGRKAQGLGLDVGDLTKANFDRLRMTRTSLVWRDDFAANLADGWNDQGQPQEHDQRSKVRAAGSMDTTISDLPKFIAALVRGDGLSSGLARRDDEAATAYRNCPSVSTLRSRSAGEGSAQGFVRRPGRRRLRRPTGPWLLQRRPRRSNRQHHGMRRGPSALCRYPVKRCSLRGRFRGSGQVHPWRHRRAL